MTRNTDDRYLREAVLRLCEAIDRIGVTNDLIFDDDADALLLEARRLAKRVDAQRGRANAVAGEIVREVNRMTTEGAQ